MRRLIPDPIGDERRLTGLGGQVSRSLRRPIFALAWTGLLALVLTLPKGGRQVPVQQWLAAFTVWIAIELLISLFNSVPIAFAGQARLGWLLDALRRKPPADPVQLRDQRALQGLLLRAIENRRTFEQQLRPRLQELAEHRKPGMTSPTDSVVQWPSDSVSVLGDVAWLVDESPTDQPPTLDDIERFLDRLESVAS